MSTGGIRFLILNAQPSIPVTFPYFESSLNLGVMIGSSDSGRVLSRSESRWLAFAYQDSAGVPRLLQVDEKRQVRAAWECYRRQPRCAVPQNENW
jgi:hypothetical protein